MIKIERPEGDDTRIWHPPFIERGEDKTAASFHGANRRKTSVVIYRQDPEDLARLKSMIALADILIENFKVRCLTKFGLDFDASHAARPALV